MQYTFKYYPQGCRSDERCKEIPVVVKWNPKFFAGIVSKYGEDGNFTSNNVMDLFKGFTTSNALRLKLKRLYDSGWFSRRQDSSGEFGRKSAYVYTFSKSAKRYISSYGLSNKNSPLWRHAICHQ